MKIAKNYILNLLYQLISILIPIITIPYVTRVLGIELIGVNALTYSVVHYFVIFSLFGISIYGSREIAYVRDNPLKLNEVFSGIFYLRLIITTVSYGLFLLTFLFVNDHQIYYLLQSVFIIGMAFDISWLYLGLEKFKRTVIRSILVKVLGLLLVFLLVKSPTDFHLYIIIMSFSNLIGNLSFFIGINRSVKFVRLSFKDIFQHFIPTSFFFISQIAVQIYLVLNKIILGVYSEISEVGFFDLADRIVKVIITIVTAMGVVMLPRISKVFIEGDMSKVNTYIYKSFEFTSYLAFPLIFGVCSIAPDFVYWFLGNGFEKTSLLIIILSPFILFNGWSNVMGQQYLVPIGMHKKNLNSVIVGACISVVTNFLLIPVYGVIGAAISTIIAQFSVVVIQFLYVRKIINIKIIFRNMWKYLLSSIVMFLVIKLLQDYLAPNFYNVILQIFTGIILYLTVLIILQSDINKYVINMTYRLIKTLLCKMRST